MWHTTLGGVATYRLRTIALESLIRNEEEAKGALSLPGLLAASWLVFHQRAAPVHQCQEALQ